MVATFRQRLRIGWAVVSALAAVTLGSITALGASPPAPAPVSVTYHSAAEVTAAMAAAQAQNSRIIQLLDPYVIRLADGTLTLNAPASVVRTVGTATMGRIASGMALVNGEIRAGRLVATADHRLYDPRNSTLSVQGGWTGLHWWWGGLDIYLSEYYTQKFMASIAIGVGVLGLCVAIPALANQAACAILAALLAIFGGIVWFIDNGNGIVLEHTWWNSNGIWAQ